MLLIGMVFVVYTMAGRNDYHDTHERSITQSVSQNYGVEAIGMVGFYPNEYERQKLLINSIVPSSTFTAQLQEVTVTCYRYVDEQAEKYFVLCDQDEPLEPLETLVKS